MATMSKGKFLGSATLSSHHEQSSELSQRVVNESQSNYRDFDNDWVAVIKLVSKEKNQP